jgi:hypothetical protein
MTRGGFVPWPCLLSTFKILFCWVHRVGVLMVTVAWGEEVNECFPVTLPLDRSLVAHPTTYAMIWQGLWPCPLVSLRASPSSPNQNNIFSGFYHGPLMGRLIEFLTTHICNHTQPMAEIGWYNYELEQYWFGLDWCYRSTMCNENTFKFVT